MPRPTDVNDHATRESRSKGGKARAAKIQAQKAEDAAKIEAAWRERLDKMHSRLDAIIANSEDGATALRAILAGHDRLAGKPTQPTEHSGTIGLDLSDDAERFDSLIADRVARHRATGSAEGSDK